MTKRKPFIPTGESQKQNGYIEITTGENKGRSKHVVTMERHIQRRVTKNEIVHHLNEIRNDNRIENLELMTRSEHSALHARNRVKKGTNYDISKQARRGEQNNASVLKAEDVKNILMDKSKRKDVARKYGVSESCIKHIRAGRTWNHLTQTQS